VVSERKEGSNVCDFGSRIGGSNFSDCREVIMKQRWGLTLYISILSSCEVRNRSYSTLGRCTIFKECGVSDSLAWF